MKLHPNWHIIFPSFYVLKCISSHNLLFFFPVTGKYVIVILLLLPEPARLMIARGARNVTFASYPLYHIALTNALLLQLTTLQIQ